MHFNVMLGDKSQSGKVHFIVYLDGVSKDGLLDIMPQGSTNLKTIINVGDHGIMSLCMIIGLTTNVSTLHDDYMFCILYIF